MPSLKLSIVASAYAPYKLARTTLSSSTTTAVAPRPKPLNRRLDRFRPPGWWIKPCAPLVHLAHDNKSPSFGNLGFRGQKLFSISSEERGSDMCSENKGDQWPPPPEDTLTAGNNNHCDHRQPPSPEIHQQNSAKLLTLPTILTIGRVASVPLLVGTFYVNSRWGTTATTSIFIAAAITDWLDGYIARKMRLGSAFGAFLDPVADKLMVAATLVLLCTQPLEVPMFGQVPWLLPVPAIAVIGREITMSAVREWAASQSSKLSEAVAVNNLGKWKTATQMIALTILLAARDSSLSGAGTLVASGLALLYISAWLAVWSLVVYMRKIWKVLLK
ncbi:hypothetical protein RHMOL_Rhmol09G0216100 [Rhododendron molle]|uniref:Uncharacterized protein n=2 Tax=Rhododendron molle TaxID=49168 RepID=A0ACC0MG37_RHOML|nr:hypothetical protein RHMOL_Rhmol09G0216100 [Rhododendron molle]KAI8539864.1 hypothetical protein RHMOL_Rhmol09G0216100 [Rhododendron molle]